MNVLVRRLEAGVVASLALALAVVIGASVAQASGGFGGGGAALTFPISSPDGVDSESFGSGSNADGSQDVALGKGATTPATGAGNIAIGYGALANTSGSDSGAIVIGNNASSTLGDSVVIGTSSTGKKRCTIVGGSSNVDDGTAFGRSATITAAGGLGLGRNASVSHANSVALGRDSSSTATNQLAIGDATGGGYPINSVLVKQTDNTTAFKLQFGGESSSFSMWQRAAGSTELQARLADGSAAASVSVGDLKASYLVEANTAGSGSPNVLASSETRTVLTNEGTTVENYHTLPSAAAGLTFTFVCQDADGIRATAAAGDTIRLAGTVSAAAGFTESTSIGSCVILVAINATEWVAVTIVGTWTVTWLEVEPAPRGLLDRLPWNEEGAALAA